MRCWHRQRVSGAVVVVTAASAFLHATLGAGTTSAATKPSTKTTSTTIASAYTGKSGAAQIVASVSAAATPLAASLGATLGKPSCPPVEKPKTGLTLQCIVAFDKSPVGWLVTLRANGTLFSRPTFPIVSQRAAEAAAGARAVCQAAAFVAAPVGSTISCAIDKTTVDVLVGPTGSLTRQG